jgi:hypothetical protein
MTPFQGWDTKGTRLRTEHFAGKQPKNAYLSPLLIIHCVISQTGKSTLVDNPQVCSPTALSKVVEVNYIRSVARVLPFLALDSA